LIAIKEYPKNAAAYTNRASVYLEEGSVQDAEKARELDECRLLEDLRSMEQIEAD
jgi:hypothetical protein